MTNAPARIDTALDEATARAEICRIGRSLFERGYVHASAGNISVRLPGAQGFLITPTDACLGFLAPTQLAHVDAEGRAVGGERASKTLALHRRIYAAETSAHCIVHTHSTHAVALTLAGVADADDALPPITPYFVMKVGHVPLVPYHRPGDPAVARLVAERIAQQHERGVTIRAVLLERLGPLVWHETPAAAMATLEELEETAKLWLMSNPKPAPLSAAQLDELRVTFGAHWRLRRKEPGMPQFAANLSMMYAEHTFLERFGAAAADGFKAVEYLFPYAHPAADLAARLADHGLKQVLFNAPPGHFEAGERGIACLPGREDEFRRGWLEQALPYAAALRCPRVHVMAGLIASGADRAGHRATYLANLAWAAGEAAAAGIDVLIEPINRRDIPGYFLNRQDDAHEIVAEVGAPNLKVQMDLYHCQIVEGDLAMKLRKYLPTGRVGHLQIAGVPDRHEPDDGEVQHPYLFALIDALGWRGHIGCEYRPSGATSAGLGWFEPYRSHQKKDSFS